jgi:hypothetical protein
LTGEGAAGWLARVVLCAAATGAGAVCAETRWSPTEAKAKQRPKISIVFFKFMIPTIIIDQIRENESCFGVYS